MGILINAPTRHREPGAPPVEANDASPDLTGALHIREVVRITGRVLDELRRNGGGNWDAHYDAMVKALGEHVASHNALSAEELADVRVAQRAVRRHDLAPERLAELAVAWVAKNPNPIPLPPPAYRR